jgi:hypothetical protein
VINGPGAQELCGQLILGQRSANQDGQQYAGGEKKATHFD